MSATHAPHPSGAHNTTFTLGGDLEVRRLGYGAMQLTGPGIWGEPADRAACVAVLRHAVELGVDFIDTADAYGPAVSEEIIREALHPYDHVVIATKAGLTRSGPGHWHVLGFPEYLTQCAEMSLRRLGVERIELFQLHRIDRRVPLTEQLGALTELQKAGKIRHIGLSEVSVEELVEAQKHAEIVSVQNLFNLTDRKAEPLVDHCAKHGVAFIPWFPFANGDLARPGGPLDKIAVDIGCTPAQAALAWLLHRSPGMLPIPGTQSMAHLVENCAAASIRLSEAQYVALNGLTG